MKPQKPPTIFFSKIGAKLYKGNIFILVITIIVFCISYVIITKEVKVDKIEDCPQFDIDEAHKISETFYWHLIVQEKDIHNRAWEEDFYARTNPPVGKYIFGAVLAANHQQIKNLKLQYEFERLWRDGESLRKLVPDQMLLLTRMTSAFFGALTATFMFLVGYLSFGWCAGVVAAVFFLAHPAILHIVRLGLYDSINATFLVLFALVCYKSSSSFSSFFDKNVHVRSAGKFLWWSVLVPALVMALAMGTKMNSFVLVPGYVCFVLLMFYSTSDIGSPVYRTVTAAATISIVMLLCCSLFIAINPYYYTNPAGNLANMLKLSHDWTVKQQLEPGGGLFTIAERFSFVGVFTLKSSELPLYKLFGMPGSWLGILLFLTGLSALFHHSGITQMVAGADAAECEARRCWSFVLLAWVGASLVGTILWLPLVWTRFLVTPYIAVCIASAVGSAKIVAVIARLIRTLCLARRVADVFGSWIPSTQRKPHMALRALFHKEAIVQCMVIFVLWVIHLLDHQPKPGEPSSLYWSDLRTIRMEQMVLFCSF